MTQEKNADSVDLVIAEAFKRVKEMPETIFQAAIKQDALIYAVPQPGRHHHVIKAMANHGIETPIVGEQGFVTTKGRFVDRVEGLRIANENNQIIEKHGHHGELYSEDMW